VAQMCKWESMTLALAAMAVVVEKCFLGTRKVLLVG